MNLFKPRKLTWWQVDLLKWAVLFIGIAIGATWPGVFAPYVTLLLALGFLLSIYLLVVWMRAKRS